MKKYEPEALAAVSRYQNWFPSLPKDVQRDVYARMRELLEEEKAYCDRGNFLSATSASTQKSSAGVA